jgi:hypothetical protein
VGKIAPAPVASIPARAAAISASAGRNRFSLGQSTIYAASKSSIFSFLISILLSLVLIHLISTSLLGLTRRTDVVTGIGELSTKYTVCTNYKPHSPGLGDMSSRPWTQQGLLPVEAAHCEERVAECKPRILKQGHGQGPFRLRALTHIDALQRNHDLPRKPHASTRFDARSVSSEYFPHVFELVVDAGSLNGPTYLVASSHPFGSVQQLTFRQLTVEGCPKTDEPPGTGPRQEL